jgi:hypothetical protein
MASHRWSWVLPGPVPNSHFKGVLHHPFMLQVELTHHSWNQQVAACPAQEKG